LGDHPLTWLDLAVQPADRHLLVTPEAERLPRSALLEAERQHAHADQVRAMDALERLANDGTHAEQIGSLGGPVARRAAAIFLAGEDDERDALALVAHRGIVDRHALARRIMNGHAALDAGHHLVLEADIGERAAHHHLVIAAARAILVEVGRLDL